MDKECGMYQILEINLTAGNGAEKIIQEIAASPLHGKLILRDDKFLGKEWYGEHLVNHLEFFTPKRELADAAALLEKLFPMESPDAQQPGQEDPGQECRVFLYQKMEGNWKAGGKNPRIYLKIVKWPFQIPFVLELIPFEGATLPLQEKALERGQQEEQATYHMFTAEEYLSRSFYHIMDDLELVYSLSWYRDVYGILTGHVVEGRKVSQSFGQLLLEDAIPRLEERLEIISSFEEYGYMQKRWENFCGRVSGVSQPEAEESHGGEEKGDSLGSEECPEWGHVIQLLVKFISPVVDATLRDELFIGDWMPQFGRYLG